MVWQYISQERMSLDWVVSSSTATSPFIRLSSDTPDNLPRKGLIAKTRLIDGVRVYSEVKKFWSKPFEQMIVFEDDSALLGDFKLAYRYVYGKNASQWLVTSFQLTKIVADANSTTQSYVITEPTDINIQL